MAELLSVLGLGVAVAIYGMLMVIRARQKAEIGVTKCGGCSGCEKDCDNAPEDAARSRRIP